MDGVNTENPQPAFSSQEAEQVPNPEVVAREALIKVLKGNIPEFFNEKGELNTALVNADRILGWPYSNHAPKFSSPFLPEEVRRVASNRLREHIAVQSANEGRVTQTAVELYQIEEGVSPERKMELLLQAAENELQSEAEHFGDAVNYNRYGSTESSAYREDAYRRRTKRAQQQVEEIRQASARLKGRTESQLSPLQTQHAGQPQSY